MNFESTINTVIKDFSQARENSILNQLNDFISRDLIVIEESVPLFFRNSDNTKLEVVASVKLVLKDKEYIEKLEKENAELKAFKQKFTALMESK